MIASLPMYWRAETAPLWQSFWRILRNHARHLPSLTPPEKIPDLTAHWRAPDLALSMTCGLPLRTGLRDQVTYVGTLDFGITDRPGHYTSQIITRPGIQTPRILALNGWDSQSGWAATGPRAHDFDRYLVTGSHAASLKAVAMGAADIAYIDAFTWRMLQRYDPLATAVIVTGQTAPTPGLPLITVRGTDPEPLRAALAAACAAQPPHDLAPKGFHVLPIKAYHDQPPAPGIPTKDVEILTP